MFIGTHGLCLLRIEMLYELEKREKQHYRKKAITHHWRR